MRRLDTLLFSLFCGSYAAELFDANPHCTDDNWGMPLQSFKIQRASSDYYQKHIQIPCATQWQQSNRPISDVYPMATAIHSKSTEDYDAFRSIGDYSLFS